MAAYIKFDGVDGESDPQHSEANLEMVLKVLDSTSRLLKKSFCEAAGV